MRLQRTQVTLPPRTQTLHCSWSWVNTRPAFSESSKSSWYPVAVRPTWRPARVTQVLGVIDDQIAQHVGFWQVGPVGFLPSPQSNPDSGHQVRGPEGFDDVVGGSRLEAPYHQLLTPGGGEENHRHVGDAGYDCPVRVGLCAQLRPVPVQLMLDGACGGYRLHQLNAEELPTPIIPRQASASLSASLSRPRRTLRQRPVWTIVQPSNCRLRP